MNTGDIRNTIAAKIEIEKNTRDLIRHLQSFLSEDGAKEVYEFIKRYLYNSAKFMDVVYDAAQKADCLPMFQPIFNACFEYWSNENDYIPDHIGIVGICDDAYLTMLLMQYVANANVPSTGQVLMPTVNSDLAEQNQVIANLLGPEIVTQLNAVAAQTFQSVYFQNSLNEIINMVAGGMMFNGAPLNTMHNMLEQNKIDEEVNVRLGAMGIF